MNSEKYIEKMKIIEDKIINFIAYEKNEEENFENLFKIIENQDIRSDKHDLKVILCVITSISNNHQRRGNFFEKIERIILIFKEDIINYFTNMEIFKIFGSNKRLSLFLVEEKIMTIDQDIFTIMMSSTYKPLKYPEYFTPEIKSFIEDYPCDEEFCQKIEEISKIDSKIFNEKRKKGENDNLLCQIIREDSIEDFIIYVKKENYLLDNLIDESIYETNEFLLKNDNITLIEYATFFGSIQIFRYLYKNDAKITPPLWVYSIHGCDEEIIHFLDDNKIKISLILSEKCIEESIKCHHNYITDYFRENLLNVDDNSNAIISSIFRFYNFLYFPKKIMDNLAFYYACKYDYFTIVQFLLNEQKIDINNEVILNDFFILNSVFNLFLILSIFFKIICLMKHQ